MQCFSYTWKQERWIFLSTLFLAAGLAWLYLFREAALMGQPGQAISSCCIIHSKYWSFKEAALVFIMWAIMMAAMMLPAVVPMALMFAFINRQHREDGSPFVATWIFVLGYLIIWTGFSALATALQWYLQYRAWLSPSMVSISPVLSSALLVLAGVYEMTPLKHACLSHCRSPLNFFMTEWREGKAQALLMGLRHGLFCTGCCGMLMALLFVLGVMNLWWVALITGIVLVEKIAPKALGLRYYLGAFLIVWGIYLWPKN